MVAMFNAVKGAIEGILGAFQFVISLPDLFISFTLGLPVYFQIGVWLVLTGVFCVMILKVKTFFTF